MNQIIYNKSNCDILRWDGGDIKKHGYPKSKTLEEMFELAQEHKCPIIVKSGQKGKWYLKGKEKKNYTVEKFKKLMNEASNKMKGEKQYYNNGVQCWLVNVFE